MRSLLVRRVALFGVLLLPGCSAKTGPEGPTGPAGAIGATGPQGAAGQTGQAGATGLQGPAGDAGPAGAMGATGAQGASGTSVTSTALDAGDPNCTYGGTAFTSSTGTTYACNGAPGQVGQQGAQGPAGPAAAYVVQLADGGSFSVDGGVLIVQGPPGPSSGNVVCGFTATSGGNLGGWQGAQAACAAACGGPTAHLCTSGEVLRSFQFGFAPSQAAFVAGEPFMATASLSGGSVSSRGDLFSGYAGCCSWNTTTTAVTSVTFPTVASSAATNCTGWTSASGTLTAVGISSTSPYGLSVLGCAAASPAVCCL